MWRLDFYCESSQHGESESSGPMRAANQLNHSPGRKTAALCSWLVTLHQSLRIDDMDSIGLVGGMPTAAGNWPHGPVPGEKHPDFHSMPAPSGDAPCKTVRMFKNEQARRIAIVVY